MLVILVILPGSAAVVPASASTNTGSWEILYDTSNLTNAASPLPMGATVLLNVAGIGPMLGITAVPDVNGFTIQSPDGKIWHWETGASSIASDSQMLSLAVPGMQEGFALYLDAQTISDLSRIPVAIDVSAKQIIFQRERPAQTPSPTETLPDGWQSFTIAKPQNMKQSARPVLSPWLTAANLPSEHDRLNVGLGLGYVQGADLGMEVTGSGKLAGGDLSASGLVTNGILGTRVRSSHLLWLDREGGRGVEGGDMYSDTYGFVQGLRYMWNAGPDRWPSISLNLNTERTGNPSGSISYMDEIKLGSAINLRGEFGTDKSQYANVRFDQYPFQFFAFRRLLSRDEGKNQGIYGSLSLSRSVSVFYGTTSSTNELNQTTTYRNTGVRIPIFKRCSLVLGQTEYQGENTSSTTRSAGLTVPLLGNMHLYLRYQKNIWDADMFVGTLLNQRNTADSLLTSLSLFASPRVHLDYQRNRYAQDGRTAYYEQLITNYFLSPKTTLQVISGFPNVADSDILRLRLDHRLKNNMSVVVDYGRLSPFQSKYDVFGKRGFMVMVKKSWTLQVPARGGRVSGIVVDQLGQPVRDITIRMGTYATISDKTGRYSFQCTPAGKYRISIADDSVPADYRVETTTHEIDVKRDSEQNIDFKLVPFGCITGLVYIDKNGDNSYNTGEGVAEVAVYANDRVTATDRDGRFSFFNLDPAHYVVRVAAEYLDKKYVVQGSATVDVDLQPKGSITDVKFQLDNRKRQIIFATLPQDP